MLTKIHEELQPTLQEIRRRLNNLLIERSQPKNKSARRHSKVSSQSWLDMPCYECQRGKAGKSHFHVNVGEVGNLYKTKKVSPYAGHVASLDLHGYTRDEALEKLDSSLKTWVDIAMRGSYPFVIPVTIICGGGGQVLSEVVEEWIKSKSNVSNAPKRK